MEGSERDAYAHSEIDGAFGVDQVDAGRDLGEQMPLGVGNFVIDSDRHTGPDEERLRALYGLMLLGILEAAALIQETETDQGVTENEALGRLRTSESANR